MKSRYLIIPILVIALIGMVAAPPPAEAELVTLSVILAAAFASAIIANEAINNETETDSAMNPGDSPTKQYESNGSRELSSTQP
jgi:heme O synthase-like polyprenyltransferase